MTPDLAQTEAALIEAYARLRATQERGDLDEDQEYEDSAMRARVLWWIILEEMPDDIRDYLLLRLCDGPASPRKGRASTKRRDLCIMSVIRQLVDKYGLTPTRNRTSAGKPVTSACGIVTRALNELGINLAEASVDAIWSRRDAIWKPPPMSALFLAPKAARFMAKMLKRTRSAVL